jgi:hypothetical protein
LLSSAFLPDAMRFRGHTILDCVRQRLLFVSLATNSFLGLVVFMSGLWEIRQMLVFPKTRRPRGGTIEEEFHFAP